MQERIAPYLLPLTHPFKPALDAIFSASRPTENEASLAQAGFATIAVKKNTYVHVVRHPAVPGYVFKLHLDSELRQKLQKPGWFWLANRCEGAEKIRHLIKSKKIKHFVAPDKWLYPLPYSPNPNAKSVVLLATDMRLVSHSKSQQAWKKAGHRVLEELYIVLSHGYGSWFLTGNVPYTKSGKFAFIDTEYPKREISLGKVKHYLSEEMQAYWEWLIIAGS
jgi:hypothetical protein